MLSTKPKTKPYFVKSLDQEVTLRVMSGWEFHDWYSNHSEDGIKSTGQLLVHSVVEIDSVEEAMDLPFPVIQELAKQAMEINGFEKGESDFTTDSPDISE